VCNRMILITDSKRVIRLGEFRRSDIPRTRPECAGGRRRHDMRNEIKQIREQAMNSS
jgi:hypothetical protein